MPGKPVIWIRTAIALLMTASGVAHISTLWRNDITLESLVVVLFGAVYLMIGLGLFGKSRFVLIAAIIFPALGAVLSLQNTPFSAQGGLGQVLIVIDAITVITCAGIYWVVRKDPQI